MVRFSIITVTYNCADVIEKTILSVLAQKYRNYEYIIIDGGSSDGTKEMIEKYQEHIACYVSEPDKGIYDAMNKGIRAARGEYLHFLNGGDCYTDDILEKVSGFIDMCPADVMYGDVYAGNNGSYHLERSQLECIDWKMNVCHQAIFMKHAGKEFNDAYEVAADYELINRLYNEGASFQYIPSAIVYYENGGKSSEWQKTKVEFAKAACLAQIKYDRRSEIAREIIAHDFMDTVNRILYINGRMHEPVVKFLHRYKQHSDCAIVWGGGSIARALIPAIKESGIRILKIIDNAAENHREPVNGIEVFSPSRHVIDRDATLFILSDRYCDEIYAQAKIMSADRNVDIVKFCEANEEYIDEHKNELMDYMYKHYGFFEKLMNLEM